MTHTPIRGSDRPKCPRCGGAMSRLGLQRIPRRFVDRLVGALWLTHRYRCRSEGCDWVGNLRASSDVHSRA